MSRPFLSHDSLNKCFYDEQLHSLASHKTQFRSVIALLLFLGRILLQYFIRTRGMTSRFPARATKQNTIILTLVARAHTHTHLYDLWRGHEASKRTF